jgi:transcriptional regulator with XRE-family HTH domain
MKDKDILVDYKPQQLIIYAEKSDGSFGPVQTGSYMSKNHIDDFYNIVENHNKSLIGKLKKGEISPISYFMSVEDLTVAELAARVGISKSTLKKHLDPKGFQNISVSMLSRYAGVFNIPLANMFQIIHTREDMKWYMGYLEESDKEQAVRISQQNTDNPILVETKIVHDTK